MRAHLTILLMAAACSDPEPAPPVEAPAAEEVPDEASESSPHALAAQVARAAGARGYDQVGELRFTFVVTQGEERAFSAVHRWDVRGQRDHVTWTGRDGVARDAIVDLRTRRACGTVAGAPAEGAAAAELSEQAYGRWVNDQYWLMMPLKLFDPGVSLALEDDREHDGRSYRVLRLSFDRVGLTPGDRYWLFVDPWNDRVVRWEMRLQDDDPNEPPSGTSWEAYRRVGPLVLAHDHRTDDGARHIRFEQTAALDAVAPADFRAAGCP